MDTSSSSNVFTVQTKNLTVVWTCVVRYHNQQSNRSKKPVFLFLVLFCLFFPVGRAGGKQKIISHFQLCVDALNRAIVSDGSYKLGK